MTVLTVAEANRPRWCNFCPDSIQPGELDATGEGFAAPTGEEGHAHADCAEHHGYDLQGASTTPDTASAVLWKALRDGIRDRGGWEADDDA